jgi:hypothetical protein
MKLINYRRLFSCMGVCLLFIMAGCFKNPEDCNTGHYLKFDYAHTNVTNKQGDRCTFTVESDIAWQLNVTPPVDWMVLDKNSGTGTQRITVTATRDNNTRGYRFAEVIATAVNDPSIQPVRLTIVQYDSTFKTK